MWIALPFWALMLGVRKVSFKIPVAYFLQQALLWQDWAAIWLIVQANALVLWPASIPRVPA